mmetsp:Transcript_124493/g.219153  ORF Transcript_124493/g.219153 Transcript_124493/m.219153 type:complete len:207 (+) Transcript_124493:1017-1637(+)
MDGIMAFRILWSTNQHTVWGIQVPHGGALCQKLWIRKNPKALSDQARVTGTIVCSEDSAQRSSSAHRHRRFFDDDLAAIGVLCNGAADALNEPQISSPAFANTPCFCWRVHRSKDNVGILNSFRHISREEKVFATASLDNLVKAWLIDRKCVTVPLFDARLIEIHNGDHHMRTFMRNCCHGWSTNVACTNATNLVHADAEFWVLHT